MEMRYLRVLVFDLHKMSPPPWQLEYFMDQLLTRLGRSQPIAPGPVLFLHISFKILSSCFAVVFDSLGFKGCPFQGQSSGRKKMLCWGADSS